MAVSIFTKGLLNHLNAIPKLVPQVKVALVQGPVMTYTTVPADSEMGKAATKLIDLNSR